MTRIDILVDTFIFAFQTISALRYEKLTCMVNIKRLQYLLVYSTVGLMVGFGTRIAEEWRVKTGYLFLWLLYARSSPL